MIRNHYLIGTVAGCAATILYLSIATGSAFGFLLFYLAPLPVLIAGFGWGFQAALVAGASGAILTYIGFGPLHGLGFGTSIAIPAMLLTHYAFLFRINAELAEGETPTEDQIEWYPVGNLVLMIAVYGGSLAMLSLLMLGPDLATYTGKVSDMLEQMIKITTKAGLMKNKLTPEQTEAFKQMVLSLLPTFTAMTWSLLILLNSWLAAHAVRMSGMLQRPWPDLAAVQFPQMLSFVMLGLLLLSFIVPGMAGLILSGYAGAFMVAFLVLGLAVTHYVTRGNPMRSIILWGTYIAVIFIGWGAVILAVVGMIEPLMNFRKLNQPETEGDR